MKERILFTSESVSEGHPDKVADQISDAILDKCLELDENAHVACETFLTKEFVLISGEISFSKKVETPNYEKIARDVLKDIGYTSKEVGIGCDSCAIDVRINTQSQDISRGVNKGDILKQGAGDQGIMFGYATNESEGYMPLPLVIAHKLVRIATKYRKDGIFKGARPDMKSQVTIDYTDKDNIRIDTILMSIQHEENINEVEFKRFILEKIMKEVAKSFGLNTDFKYLINPTGRFVIGGPLGDTGLTGRKIIVDTYGGSARHGGGAFSGKDPSKVDRSATYYARYIAKNLVAANVCDAIEIELSYAIGVSDPISIGIVSSKNLRYSEEKILSIIRKVFDARPGAIISNFKLTHPTFKYHELTNYGHFGRPDLDLPFEKLDKVEEIKALL